MAYTVTSCLTFEAEGHMCLYVVMADIVMAYRVMVDIVMAYIYLWRIQLRVASPPRPTATCAARIVMADIVMVDMVTAYIVMADIIMAHI